MKKTEFKTIVCQNCGNSEQVGKFAKTNIPCPKCSGKMQLNKPEQSVEVKETVASIPMMITNQMRADLVAKGTTEAAIRQMTPQQAWDTINAPSAPPKPVTIDIGNIPANEVPKFAESVKSAMGTLPPVTTETTVKMPVVPAVPSITYGERFRPNMRVQVQPHQFIVSGVVCEEPGFKGVVVQNRGFDPTNGDFVIMVRKDKSGSYAILAKHITPV